MPLSESVTPDKNERTFDPRKWCPVFPQYSRIDLALALTRGLSGGIFLHANIFLIYPPPPPGASIASLSTIVDKTVKKITFRSALTGKQASEAARGLGKGRGSTSKTYYISARTMPPATQRKSFHCKTRAMIGLVSCQRGMNPQTSLTCFLALNKSKHRDIMIFSWREIHTVTEEQT